MPENRVDLVNLFQSVAQTLAQNQQSLNQRDEYNHDHGTNMVQTFQTITSSLQQKQGKSDSTALAYAAKKLSKSSTSSSGKLYAQGLTQAATKFKRKKVDSKGALDLLQTLIGGGQTSPQAQQPGSADMLETALGQLAGGAQSQPSELPQAGGDLMGALMGQLAGGAHPQAPGGSQPGNDLLGALLGQVSEGAQPKPSNSSQVGSDMLSTLLGGTAGSQTSSSGSGGGIDLGDLLNAGMSYMQAKQQGGSTAQALIQAFTAASGMGSATHRKESTSLVVNSFLQALASSGK
jgi:hypothetical protein